MVFGFEQHPASAGTDFNWFEKGLQLGSEYFPKREVLEAGINSIALVREGENRYKRSWPHYPCFALATLAHVFVKESQLDVAYRVIWDLSEDGSFHRQFYFQYTAQEVVRCCLKEGQVEEARELIARVEKCMERLFARHTVAVVRYKVNFQKRRSLGENGPCDRERWKELKKTIHFIEPEQLERACTPGGGLDDRAESLLIYLRKERDDWRRVSADFKREIEPSLSS